MGNKNCEKPEITYSIIIPK